MLSDEILNRFREVLDAAAEAGEPEPTAMVLATGNTEGDLTTRTVLLKGLDERGFVFYTNTLSTKGQQLRALPRAAATFLWKATQCQVQITGAVERVTDAEADAYFATRERASQIGAWASKQSEPAESREQLDRRVEEFEQKFAGRDVPRPPHWSGYRVLPDMVEFWFGRQARLHDRFRYRLEDGDWVQTRLFP